VEAGLKEQLNVTPITESHFGAEWFASQNAGEYLISLWRRGQEFSSEELAIDMGYDGLDAQYLIEELVSMQGD